MKDIDIETLKAMKLHEKFHPPNGSLEVLRVPGGWIYTNIRFDHNCMTSTFVPESP